MQKSRNSIANALELCLSCTNPSTSIANSDSNEVIPCDPINIMSALNVFGLIRHIHWLIE